MKRGESNRAKWIATGYRQFGESGPTAINVEKLSLLVGLSRSSFYHFFGDVTLFESKLLEHHVSRFQMIGETLSNSGEFSKMVEDLLSFSEDMKFHRQLLIHQDIPRYLDNFNSAKHFTEKVVFKLWSEYESEITSHDEAREFRLYQIVRDYHLVHFGKLDEKTILSTIRDVKMLVNSQSSL